MHFGTYIFLFTHIILRNSNLGIMGFGYVSILLDPTQRRSREKKGYDG